MTDRTSRAVAPVSAVCAAFAAQPSTYPPEAPKPDVAPTCGSVRQSYSTEAGAPAGGFRRRNEPQAAKQEKAKVSCAHLGEHICPQCGQFGAFTQGLLRGQKQPHWGRKRK